jgi:hypothetical protein
VRTTTEIHPTLDTRITADDCGQAAWRAWRESVNIPSGQHLGYYKSIAAYEGKHSGRAFLTATILGANIADAASKQASYLRGGAK